MIKPSEFTDITYEVSELIATITINRPDRYNALRGRTVDELLAAFKHAWVDKNVGAIILTGAGEKAFCTGGDQKNAQLPVVMAIPKPECLKLNHFIN